MWQRWQLAAAAVLCAASTTLAAPAGGGDGYEAPKLEDKTLWLAALFAALFLAVALVVAFRNSRRTHLD